jgi:hypothetical protein
MHKKKCTKAFYAKVVFANHVNDSLHFTMFDNSIKQIVEIYNTQNSQNWILDKGIISYS